MTLKLPADVYSPDHVGIALWELGRLIPTLGDAVARARVTPEAGQPEIQVSAFLMKIMSANGVSAADRQALEQLQVELRSLRDVAPTAHILLAASPGQAIKRQLVDWFRSEISPQHLLTFAARGDIGGGFMLRIGSKQYDFTYRTQLLADKHRLVEIFDSVRK